MISNKLFIQLADNWIPTIFDSSIDYNLFKN